MKLLLDMNLPPSWVPYLQREGIDAVHWATIGSPRAPDTELMAWARDNGCVVFTHDLDFSVLVATTGAAGPSILQVRTLDVTTDAIGNAVLRAIRIHGRELELGAIVSIDSARQRVRLLPIRSRE